ncbi:MAG TPA: S53 family peptidase [Terriglobales bacterium]|nr:S53 family peptidase [Terriglobales bacterium]
MNSRSVFTLLLIVALPLSAFSAASSGAHKAARTRRNVSTLLVKGPQAIPSGASTPKYGLFLCQVGLEPDGSVCYDPYQIRHAYNIDTLINAGLTGKGKTIIIVDAFQSPNIVSQLNNFISFYGLPSMNGLGGKNDPSLGTFTQIAPDGLTPFIEGDEDMTGWAEEISLDVLWAHAIAPGANIVLDLAASDEDSDILSATQYAVNHNLGDIISQSFGENESCVDSSLLAAQHKLFVKATLKHITLLASSGDEGAAQQTCDGNSWTQAASSPASDPLVTAVGGTELHAADYCLTQLGCDPTTNPAFGTYQGEVAWNEPDLEIATGGGFSVLYRLPFYQLGTVPLSRKGKGVPDVSYSAAVEHGVLTYLDIPGIPAGFYSFGGTSAGSPQWAGIVAIADQKAKRGLGFINATLYLFSLIPQGYSTMFHDITSGNNTVTEQDVNNKDVTVTGFNAGKKWDATTGLGSPKADQVVNFLTLFKSDSDASQAMNNSDPGSSHRSGRHKVRTH